MTADIEADVAGDEEPPQGTVSCPQDRLGGSGWQTRKARMKNRIREIAHELLKVAAERLLRAAPKLNVSSGIFDEFCAGFPYEETDDQQAAIDAVIGDLEAGRPMDRR